MTRMQYEECLADDGSGKFVLGRTSALRLLVERGEHTVGVVVDYFASVDDFLSAHHHTAGQRNAAQQVCSSRLRSFFIIYKVGLHIVVEIAAGENLPLGCISSHQRRCAHRRQW